MQASGTFLVQTAALLQNMAVVTSPTFLHVLACKPVQLQAVFFFFLNLGGGGKGGVCSACQLLLLWVWNANYWGQPVSTSRNCQAIIIKLYKPSYWFPLPVIVIVSVKYWLLGAAGFHQLWLSGHYNKAVQTIILIPFGLFFIEPMHMCDRWCEFSQDSNNNNNNGNL